MSSEPISAPISSGMVKIEVNGHEFAFKPLVQGSPIFLGKSDDDILLTGFQFHPSEYEKMIGLFGLSFVHNCLLSPSLVDKNSSFAVYKRIQQVWEPHRVKLECTIEAEELESEIESFPAATLRFNEIVREMLSFVVKLHKGGFILGAFDLTDLILLPNDPIPKFWRTEIYKPRDNAEFAKLRLDNLRQLSDFFRKWLQERSEHTEYTVPGYTQNFLRMLSEGKSENLHHHIQVIGLEEGIVRLKSILNKAYLIEDRSLVSGKDLALEWKRFTNDVLVIRRGDKWREKLEDRVQWPMLRYVYIEMKNAGKSAYNNTMADFLRFMWDMLIHVCENFTLSYGDLYAMIEEAYPGLICDFFEKIEKYPELAEWGFGKQAPDC